MFLLHKHCLIVVAEEELKDTKRAIIIRKSKDRHNKISTTRRGTQLVTIFV
jgi:hypothetical protein